ncbi:hypothetical protein [Streptomyces sp. NPDC090445]|uniref:hypothetical protein n=1 Tax=Streptomyces sp. NPDC090445 TaxID=3365963 RepID=UPI0038116ADE
MQITISSFERWGDQASFDTDSAVLGPIRRAAGPDVSSGSRGCFGRLGEILAVLYRVDGVLRLRLGDRDMVLTGDLAARHERGESINNLTVGTLRIAYPRPVEELDEDDPTAFAEPEDFDMGLFLANILNDPDRCDRTYR